MARVATPVKNVPFFLKKITPKFVTEALVAAGAAEVEGAINLLQLARPVQPRHLYDLYGVIRVATIVPDKSGTKQDSVRFSGKLKAYTPPDANGEQYIFESGQAFIPILDTYLYSALKSAQEVEAGAYLEVALSIGIKQADQTKPSMTGYEWEVQKLIAQPPAENDPIERLRLEAKIQQSALLAAPKSAGSGEPVRIDLPSVADTLKKESAPGAGATSGLAPTSSGTSSSGSSPTGSLSTASSEPSPKHGKGRHPSA